MDRWHSVGFELTTYRDSDVSGTWAYVPYPLFEKVYSTVEVLGLEPTPPKAMTVCRNVRDILRDRLGA